MVCVSVYFYVYLFTFLSMLALSATLLPCVTGKCKVQPDHFHRAALLRRLVSYLKCCLRVVVKDNESVSLFQNQILSDCPSVQNRQPLNNRYAATVKNYHQPYVIRSKISLGTVQYKLFART